MAAAMTGPVPGWHPAAKATEAGERCLRLQSVGRRVDTGSARRPKHLTILRGRHPNWEKACYNGYGATSTHQIMVKAEVYG